MPLHIQLQMEVAGCPTICMHCWAQGVPYNVMPLRDVRHVLEQAHDFCMDADLSLVTYPMHEVAAHPQAAEVLELFHAMAPEGENPFQPFSTTGVPLAVRDDWREILIALKERGTTHVYFALHGVDEVHDRVVSRAGAYQETCMAVERVRSVGLHAGCNVFITKENVQQVDLIAEAVQTLGIEETAWEPAGYYPTSRGRRYEQSRPTLDQLAPVAGKIARLSTHWKDKWANLETYTEATYVKNALANHEGFDYFKRAGIKLVCRNNLDLHIGDARLYGRRLGNLQKDGAEALLRQAVDDGSVSDDALFFPDSPIPSVYELANRVGDPQGQNVYFQPESMRYRWLDLALGKTKSSYSQ